MRYTYGFNSLPLKLKVAATRFAHKIT